MLSDDSNNKTTADFNQLKKKVIEFINVLFKIPIFGDLKKPIYNPNQF